MAENKKATTATDTTVQINGDAFSNMLSQVVNDPTIKVKETIKEEPKKIAVQEVKAPVAEVPQVVVQVKEQAKTGEPVSPDVKNAKLLKEEPVNPVLEKNDDKIAIAVTAETKPATSNDLPKEKQSEPGKPEVPENRNTIIKKLSSKTNLGIEGIYIDSNDNHSDTITVFIAVEKEITDTVTVKKSVAKKPEADTATAGLLKGEVLANAELKSDNKPTPPTTVEQNKPVAKLNVEKPVEPVHVGAVAIINSDCKALASEEDFLKLRKKMAAANNEEMMIIIAKKVFKSKCFMTEQIKNLGSLFLKDEKRYGFFDAAYPFVSDSQNFPILESQLTDGYYINRFKVMIRH